MTADDQLESGRNGGRRRRHDEPSANARAEPPRRSHGHRGRGLPSGNDAYVVQTFRSARGVLTFRFALSAFRERRVDEAVRCGRSDTGPDNRQEIVSKIRE
jgi:hypothetical protein